MWHLSKLCRPLRPFRHLLCYFDHNLFQASCNVSLLLESKGRDLSSLVAREKRLHTYLIRRGYVGSLLMGSQINRTCQHEKVESNRLQSNYLPFVSVRCQQTSSRKHLLDEIKAKEYINLYLSNKIRFFRVFCRTAKISTVLFVIGAPGCAVAATSNMLPVTEAIYLASTLAFYAVILTAQSYFFMSRVVCKIMISSDETYLKVSHLSLYGQRRDIYVGISDIIPDTGSVYNKRLIKIQFKNSSRKLIFLPQSGGEDTNFEALEMLLTRRQEETKKEEK